MGDSVLRAALAVTAIAFRETASNGLAIGAFSARMTRDADLNIMERAA